jgi:hypothetical protein
VRVSRSQTGCRDHSEERRDADDPACPLKARHPAEPGELLHVKRKTDRAESPGEDVGENSKGQDGPPHRNAPHTVGVVASP